MINYRRATIKDLERMFDKEIQENLDDKRYLRWKDEFIESNKLNNSITFVVLDDDEPVGQASLVLNKNVLKFACKDLLCGESTAYLSAIRIKKEYEGHGYISKLVKMMESFAKQNGIKFLTIGVEAKETRNIGIYLHFGFNEFIDSVVDDGELVLFYKKGI